MWYYNIVLFEKKRECQWMQNVLTIDYGTNIKQTGTTFDVYIIIHDVHVHECTNVQKLKTNNIYCCFNQNATHIFLTFLYKSTVGFGSSFGDTYVVCIVSVINQTCTNNPCFMTSLPQLLYAIVCYFDETIFW